MPNNLHELAEEKTPEELAAEIANTAASLGGHSPKDKAAMNEDGKIPKSAVEVETKNPKAEDNSESKTIDTEDAKESPVKTEVKSDEDSQKISVNVKTRKQAIKPSGNDENKIAEEEKPKSEENKVISRSGKTIAPLSEADKKKDAEAVDEAAQTVEVEQKQAAPQEEDIPVTNSAEEKPEAATKLDTIASELEEKSKQKSEENSTQQQAKVFDTNEYHLPIKASKHHRKGIHAWMWLVILLVTLFVAAGYFYVTQTGPFSEVGSDFLKLMNS